ncbi:MAG: autotransporter-associated beta strand repeat-containing protein [Rhodoplanes sp.]
MLAINRSDTYAFNGVISGTGALVQNGTGATILTTTNTYSGTTTINAGTLIVDGSIANSAVIVNNGALLTGNGAVGPTTINGALLPGQSIGTITVNGDLTFGAVGVYLVEVSPRAPIAPMSSAQPRSMARCSRYSRREATSPDSTRSCMPMAASAAPGSPI